MGFGEQLVVSSFNSPFSELNFVFISGIAVNSVNQMSKKGCSKWEGPFHKLFAQVKVGKSDLCLVIFIIVPLCEVTCLLGLLMRFLQSNFHAVIL